MTPEAPSFLVIDVDSAADPDGEKLHALLKARFAYERARGTRTQWFKLLFFLLACVLGGAAIGFSLVADNWVAALAVSTVLLVRAIAALRAEDLQYRRWVQLRGECQGGVQVRGT